MTSKINKYLQANNIAFIAAFLGGVFIHFFGLVNILHNHDNIYTLYGYGSGITSGRWFLTFLGDILEKLGLAYNVSWIWGVIFLFFLALCSKYLVLIFSIKNQIFAVLLGLLFVSFPSVTSAMFYRYTVIYYGLAIFLAVFSAYILTRTKKNFVLNSLVATILMACSMGIYQAYFPITVSLLVLNLLQQSILNDKSYKKLLLRGMYYLFFLIAGLLLYFIVLKITLFTNGLELTAYKGINEMGNIDFKNLPYLFWKAFIMFIKMPINNNYSLAPIRVFRILYIVLAVISMGMFSMILYKNRANIGQNLFAIILCAIFPLAVNLIEVMTPKGRIYTLMEHSFVMIFVVSIVLHEALPKISENLKTFFSKSIIILLAAVIFFYSYLANVNYTSLYYINRQTENYLSTMVGQIRMTPGYSEDKRWAFIGKIEDLTMYNFWDQENIYFGGVIPTTKMLTYYSWQDWIRHYIGYNPVIMDRESTLELSRIKEVGEMPCWPDYGSIKIVDDIIVIKFSE